MKQLHRLNNIKRNRIFPNKRPKDAASLLIFDLDNPSGIHVLMGRRHPEQDFIPDKLVFPGGRVSAADSRISVSRDLAEPDRQNILFDMKGRPSRSRARGIALAAIRETFEETGLLIGRTGDKPQKSRSSQWRDYLGTGISPDLCQLTFIARAITPPRTSRRYDTRFFLTTKTEIAKTVGNGDGEFTETLWIPVCEADKFDIHPMPRAILDDAMTRINPKTGRIGSGEIPYYFMQNGIFRRNLING